MADHHDIPFKCEYAKSNRASCKGCKGGIEKDTLRMAIMVQSPNFDGKIPNWFHFQCFWKRAKVATHTDVHGFDSVRWEDQQKIKEKIGGGGGGGGTSGDVVDGAGDYKDYVAEYAKSGRSTCRGCEDKIEKDLVRLSCKDYEGERSKLYGPQDQWYHVDCFNENRDDLEFTSSMDPSQIPGFKKLKKDDQDMVLKKLGKGEQGKKRKAESGAAAVAAKKPKKETKEEKALKDQSQFIWKFRDQLSKEVSNDALKGLLEYNRQELPSGESKLLDCVADAMAFGLLQPCEECGGQLRYSKDSSTKKTIIAQMPVINYSASLVLDSGDGYRCTGNLTQWTKCLNITKTPKRKPFKVPKECHDVEFLKNYKYVSRSRVFPEETASSLSGPVSSAGEGDKPLAGMKFLIAGKTIKSKADLTQSITQMGGSVVSKVDQKVTAVVSTKAEVEKMSKFIKQAKASDTNVVDEDFLNSAKKGGAALFIKQHSIAPWGGDPHERVEDVPDGIVKKSGAHKSMMSARDEARYTKSVPKTMKMTVKGRAAVDPESGLETSAHVLQQGSDLYTAVLGLVDLVRGTNSYYKLQLLESDGLKSWWVFRAWGRVGTTIGGNKTEVYRAKHAAVEAFKNLYGEKTGNDWETRSNFEKCPNKFYPLDIDYGADSEEVKQLDASAGSNSKLDQSVQDLIRLIFDVDSMKKIMLEFEIDLKKMPLGKLSKKQIESAYSVLTELLGLIKDEASQTRFLDASNRFYTLIPHDFGMKKPPLLDTEEIIRSKCSMLDNLLDIEVAYSLMKGGKEGDVKDPIDAHYEKLKTDIQPMDKKSEEYTRLLEYVKNTHAATHNQYELEVEEIWKIKREGEHKRYRPFKDLGNRMLLWHGSRSTNYAGILSQGLRIAPPEAPVTGYMFGKGVYFADMVSKSANYCRTSKSDPKGLMLLCEVALGNMYELTGAEYIEKLPKGKHSTKGIGMHDPDPKHFHTTQDGVVIPMGKAKKSSGYSSLLYNEYIVYDVGQINCQYLFQMNFKFKSLW